jgi:hypothetical protein
MVKHCLNRRRMVLDSLGIVSNPPANNFKKTSNDSRPSKSGELHVPANIVLVYGARLGIKQSVLSTEPGCQRKTITSSLRLCDTLHKKPMWHDP